jgi:hypothetical protein
MRHSVLSAAAVAAVAVVMVLLAFPTQLGSARTETAPVGTPVLPVGEKALADQLGAEVGWTPAQTAAAEAWLAGLTPAQHALLVSSSDAMFRSGVRPSAQIQSEFSLKCIPGINAITGGSSSCAGFSYYCFGASVVAGISLGALAGGGVGGVVGGVAGAVAGLYFCQTATAAAGAYSGYKLWAVGINSAYGNQVNTTSADYHTLLSALNTSASGWDRAADNAALLQLPNATFNVSNDLFQSGLDAQFAPLITAYETERVSAWVALLEQVFGYGDPGALYASAGLLVGCCSLQWSLASGSGVTAQIGSVGVSPHGANGAVGVYILNGANITSSITSALPVRIQSAIHPSVFYNWTTASGTPKQESFPGPTGLYNVDPSGGNNVAIQDGIIAPTAINTNVGDTNFTAYVPAYNQFYEPDNGGCDWITDSGHSWQTACIPNDYTGVGQVLDKTIANLLWEAAQSGEAYWTFLRAIGYTSESQVSPSCIIPAPYMTLPSAIDATTLNVSEWKSLYLGTLTDIAHFYNTTLSGTSFCGTQAKEQFSIGSEPWGNLFVNATGDVYLTNGSVPINVNGTSLPTEAFGNVSTWAVTHQQLYLMPTIGSVHIPVGVRWAVPQADPIEVFATGSGTMLWTTGNGTGNATGCAANTGKFCAALAQLGPGDAIYISSCAINGTPTTGCSVNVQTLNATAALITCDGPCSQGGSSGGVGFSLGGLLSAIGGFFCWVSLGLICGSTATAVAEVVVALIVIALVVLAFILVDDALKGRRKRSDGSSPPRNG